MISTHAPAGGATVCGGRTMERLTNFYSRPCGRGDFWLLSEPVKTPLFLLTPLREGRRVHKLFGDFAFAYFYSRPCGRGDLGTSEAHFRAVCISTHAPAGGATHSQIPVKNVVSISTHAPAGGATNRLRELAEADKISTHAPAGGATDRALLYEMPKIISTHAPAGGATV